VHADNGDVAGHRGSWPMFHERGRRNRAHAGTGGRKRPDRAGDFADATVLEQQCAWQERKGFRQRDGDLNDLQRLAAERLEPIDAAHQLRWYAQGGGKCLVHRVGYRSGGRSRGAWRLMSSCDGDVQVVDRREVEGRAVNLRLAHRSSVRGVRQRCRRLDRRVFGSVAGRAATRGIESHRGQQLRREFAMKTAV
jgi:hypothetical protein